MLRAGRAGTSQALNHARLSNRRAIPGGILQEVTDRHLRDAQVIDALNRAEGSGRVLPAAARRSWLEQKVRLSGVP